MNTLVLLTILMCSFIGPSYQILCSKSCSANETFSQCGAGAGECQKTCLTRKRVEDLGCACTPGCICRDGYFRDANTYKCIAKRDCPSLPVAKKSCPRNEVYSGSLAGCQKTCDTQDIMFKCIPKAGCICREGYFRSSITNQCISKKSCEQCPPNYQRDPETKRCVLSCQICKDPNAEFTKCGSSCQPSCDKPVIGACNKMCNTGCYCKKGYIQNPMGKCILPEECLKPNCPANEILSCRNPTCDGEGCVLSKQACLDVPCQTKCYCADGYVRINGTCVLREKCSSEPTVCEDPNAVFDKCASSCQPTCAKPVVGPCNKMCNATCVCQTGFIQNESGKCIKPEQCLKPSCPENELLSCRIPSCVYEGCKAIKFACVEAPCENKCFCKDGYVRIDGKCVLRENCPPEPTVCDDPNSVFNKCASSCQPTCAKPVVGPCNKMCNATCVCQPGFIQNESGKCIKPEECVKPSCPENELLSCRIPSCVYEGCEAISPACVEAPCENKCFCKDGYVRIDGKCVLRENCPPEPTVCKDPNSVFNRCASSCQPTCAKPVVGPCNKMCNATCVCKPGFIQNESGKCIKPEECVKPSCPENESLSCRIPSCVYEGCEAISFACVEAPCENKCFCKDGYVRIDGKCVPREQCNIAAPQ